MIQKQDRRFKNHVKVDKAPDTFLKKRLKETKKWKSLKTSNT